MQYLKKYSETNETTQQYGPNRQNDITRAAEPLKPSGSGSGSASLRAVPLKSFAFKITKVDVTTFRASI